MAEEFIPQQRKVTDTEINLVNSGPVDDLITSIDDTAWDNLDADQQRAVVKQRTNSPTNTELRLKLLEVNLEVAFERIKKLEKLTKKTRSQD